MEPEERVQHLGALHPALRAHVCVCVCVRGGGLFYACVLGHACVLWQGASVYLGLLLGAEGSQREHFSTCYPSILLSSHQRLSSLFILTQR